jgi:adenosylcobinamide-phosphate synthase
LTPVSDIEIGARLDDMLNIIPARLNGFFLYCASGFRKEVIETMVRDGKKHPSPNSGISEAGFSGFLGIRLGGSSTYEGVLKTKPWIGEDRFGEKELDEPEIILKAVNFYWRIVTVTLIIFLGTFYLFRLPLVFK